MFHARCSRQSVLRAEQLTTTSDNNIRRLHQTILIVSTSSNSLQSARIKSLMIDEQYCMHFVGYWHVLLNCDCRTTKHVQNTEYRIQNTEYRIQNTEYRIQNTEYRIQNTEYRIQNTEYRIQNTEYRIQNTEYRIQNTEYRIQNTEYRIQRMRKYLYFVRIIFTLISWKTALHRLSNRISVPTDFLRFLAHTNSKCNIHAEIMYVWVQSCSISWLWLRPHDRECF